MIAGIETSVSDLKKTFPLCRYFVITEFPDFDIENQNYANTEIDEIYMLRKQIRGEYRKSGIAKPISIEVIRALIDEASLAIRLINQKVPV